MPEQRAVTYRPMTQADLPVARYIAGEAMTWLMRSQGSEPPPFRPAYPRLHAHILRTDPDGSSVAEIDGLPVGFSQSLVRGEIWFLAQLFVQPEVHALGIGQELLGRAYEYGRTHGARIFSVVSSTSPVAQSLYMRAGMFAVGIGYRMTGPLDALRVLPEPDGNKKRIVDCGGWQDRMAELDRAVFGAERRADHAFFLSGESTAAGEASFGLSRDGELLGYGYASEDGGWIGPIAAYDPRDQLPLLRMAAEWLRDREIGTGTMWVLSANRTIMSALLTAGWRVGSWTFFLVSEPFGQFDRYHPSGGVLL